MKKLETFLILLFLILFFSNASTIVNLSSDILQFWFTELVPSLFLSIFIIQLLSATSFFTSFAKGFSFLCPLFNLNEEALGFLFSCLFIGAPSSASLIHEAYQKEQITSQMAQRLFLCTPVSTISFLVMSAGSTMLNSQKAGLILWLIQVLSSFCLVCATKSVPITMNPSIHQKKHSITSALLKTGSLLFLIGGYLLMFQTLSYLIGLFIPTAFRSPLNILSEFSYGCAQLAERFRFHKAYVLMSALCGFNGFCVHFQSISLSELKVPYLKYLSFRIIQSLLSLGFAIATLPLLDG